MIWKSLKLMILNLKLSLSVRFALMSILCALRRFSRVQNLIKITSITRLRNQFNLPLMGDDDSLDLQLHEAVYDFFDRNIEKSDLYKKECDYLNWLLDSPSSKSDREKYFRVTCWLYSYIKRTKNIEKIPSIYNSIYNKNFDRNKKFEQVDKSEIWKIHREFRNKFRQERRILHKSKVKLIDFSPKDIMEFLPLLSIMFVIAGYFYISFLYSHFNVNTSQFFLISDYLASSVEQIEHALYSLIGPALGLLYAFRVGPTISKYEHERQRRSYWRDSIFISVAGLIVLIPTIFPIIPAFHTSIIPSTILPAIVFTSQAPVFFISSRFFENSRFVYSFCMAMIIFFSSLYTSALTEINEIENGRPEMIFEIRSGGQKYTDQNSIFIGSNSRYIFLYNKHKNTQIIPLSQIKYISLETRS